MSNLENANVSIAQQRDMLYIFLSEMETMHRAIRQLHDSGFIISPTPAAAESFANKSILTLIQDGHVVNLEGTKVYGAPAVIDSLNTVLMNATTRNATRDHFSTLTFAEIKDLMAARTENNMPEALQHTVCRTEIEINAKEQ